MDKHKNEIRETERAFAKLAKENGVKAAFLAYASDEAVLSRGGKLIKGRQEIEAYFDSVPYQNVRLEWTPEFIDVSESGDLGYTYGPYIFEGTDATGKETRSEGIFHTVWKRNRHGEWRYVWD